MRIQAVGPGRKGTMDQGLGKLTLSDAKGHEVKQLLVLYQEPRDGNAGFWIPSKVSCTREQREMSPCQKTFKSPESRVSA